jgi:hypothetical protein
MAIYFAHFKSCHCLEIFEAVFSASDCCRVDIQDARIDTIIACCHEAECSPKKTEEIWLDSVDLIVADRECANVSERSVENIRAQSSQLVVVQVENAANPASRSKSLESSFTNRTNHVVVQSQFPQPHNGEHSSRNVGDSVVLQADVVQWRRASESVWVEGSELVGSKQNNFQAAHTEEPIWVHCGQSIVLEVDRSQPHHRPENVVANEINLIAFQGNFVDRVPTVPKNAVLESRDLVVVQIQVEKERALSQRFHFDALHANISSDESLQIHELVEDTCWNCDQLRLREDDASNAFVLACSIVVS